MRDIYANEDTTRNTPFLPADIFDKTKAQRAAEAAAKAAAEKAARDGLDFWTSDDTLK